MSLKLKKSATHLIVILILIFLIYNTHSFWPGIILYQQDNERRSVNRWLAPDRRFSIQYCGSKHQFYDHCHFTRSLPFLVGDVELFKVSLTANFFFFSLFYKT